MRPISVLLAAGGALLAEAAKLRVLFVGNSYTYVNELPGQLQNVARSLGDEVETSSSTIGGCTLYAQEAGRDGKTAKLLEQEWDYIVLQDYSALPTVKKAREVYMKPAVEDVIARKKAAKVVLYLTWGYHDGVGTKCPSGTKAQCFPLGPLANFTEPSCSSSAQYQQSVRSFECMGYSVARGYFSAMDYGADLVAPCGLAWQVVRGSASIPADCKAAVDAGYPGKLPLELPLRVEGGALPDRPLYIRNWLGSVDKHQNLHGCYLNALVFYATLFGKSPVGAAPPVFSWATWGVPPKALAADEVLALQRAAEGTVKQCGEACGLAGGVFI